MPSIIITGAGSGVGRATAILFASRGWEVCVVGRKEKALEATIAAAGASVRRIVPILCDVSNPLEIERASHTVQQYWPDGVDVLVNGAGTNTQKRSLRELTLENYRDMIETNMTGAYLWSQKVLPGMRARGKGTIVNIVSDAARQASAKAGPAYAMSKFGMLGLTQAINAEERPNGIRASAILPGDIDTPLLEKRPVVPDAEARSKMIQPEDIAECVWLCATLPKRAVIEEMLVRPGG